MSAANPTLNDHARGVQMKIVAEEGEVGNITDYNGAN